MNQREIIVRKTGDRRSAEISILLSEKLYSLIWLHENIITSLLV